MTRTLFGSSLLCLGAVGCGTEALSTDPLPTAVVQLEVVGGDAQDIWSAGRSDAPFEVRALDGAGRGVPGTIISFRVTGEGSGVLSQPSAITNASGSAETYLLDARPGLGEIVATAG